MTSETHTDTSVRDEALRHLKQKRDFYAHLVVYVLVNSFIVVIWAMTGSTGFFWPVFPIFAWGIGIVMQAWEVFFRPTITEADIDREVTKMTRH